MSGPDTPLYEFGPFRLDSKERRLLRDGQPVSLAPKAFDTLVALVERSGHVVEKDFLLSTISPDAAVEESTLAQYVFTLRKALGDGQYIETVPKYGYRFVAPVTEMRRGEAFAEERHTRSRLVTEVEEGGRDTVGTVGALPEPPVGVAGRSGPGRSRHASAVASVMLLLLAAVIAGIVFFSRSKTKEAGSATEVKLVAVLPFAPISQEGGDEYLELGMADALITRLSGVKRIVVRPTTSVRKYIGADRDPIAAGRELRVDSVLEGSVQKLGDRIRVTARLVRVEDGRAIWSGEFDERSADIFTVQDRISEQITAALALTLTGEERKLLARRYTSDPEAYQLYQKGRFFWNKRTSEALKKAIEYFQQAIDRDPKYALAYAGLADACALVNLYGALQRQEVFRRAEAAARVALDIDDTLAEAHVSLAYVKYYHDWDWPGAEREFKRAIEIDRNYATAHQWYAEYLFYMGRFDESIVEINQAHDIDPISPVINTELGSPYLYMGQYDRAIDEYRKVSDLDPDFPLASYCLGLCYEGKSMYKEAIREYQKTISLLGGGAPAVNTFGYASVAYVYAVAGDKKQARNMLDKLVTRSKREPYSSYGISFLEAGLGDKEEALAWLEKAFEDRDERMVMLKVDQHFNSLRGEPRFQQMLSRLRLDS